ncbi:MAG: starch-binding protein [Ruminococcus sp.]|nr:starch-binding protein [Ruminococcus sp.]
MNKSIRKLLSVTKRSISLVIAFGMMLSVAAISGVSLNAASGGSRFSNGDYIYVSKTDAKWANFGDVVCHMYSAWPDDPGAYIDSIVMQKISDDYYRCFMLADNVRYLKFKLTNGNDWWIKKNGNPVFSVNYDDNSNNPSYGNNCVYVKDTGANSCDWGMINSNDPDYNPSNTKGSFNEKTATLSSNITSRKDLTLVKGTFYDYYNNDQIRKGWTTNLDGSERSYTDREPFTFFNKAIAEYSRSHSNWSYPLYFGDFNRSGKDAYGPGPWYDNYKGAGVSNFNKYLARANNSNMTSSGVYGTVSGLVDTTLKGGSTGTVTKDGVVLPYFDKNFISQGYGSIVNSQFPFRQENRNGDTYHIYESLEAKDNFYFSNLAGSPVANYYNYSNAIIDAAAGFGNASNGKGFFPFDNGGTEAKNFGFGMKLEIPFSLNKARTTENGNDVIFEFSGDDDLWVYVDGKLVLDMGGAHKMASGTINFTEQTVKVNAVDGSYGNPSTGNIKNVDGGEDHVMTVFYMERGMIESNLAIEYNFSPLDNLLTTEKVVNTANVNEGLKVDTAKVDEFKITNSVKTTYSTVYNALSYKDYKYLNKNGKGTSDSNGSYKIKDGEKVAFSNIVSSDKNDPGPKVGDNIKVSEDLTGTYLSYSTTYKVTDEDNSSFLVNSGSGKETEFRFINTNGTSSTADDSVNEYAYYNVEFVNTPDVGNITVSKKVKDDKGNDIDTDTKSFNFKIGIDLKGGNNYKYYNLAATNGTTATNGSFTLKDNQSITFKGIPANATYIVTETADSDYVTSSTNASGKVVNNTNMPVEFINKQINKDAASVVFEANKVVDNGLEQPEEGIFNFEAYEYKLNSSSQLVLADNVADASGSNDKNGKVSFTPIEYAYVAPSTEPTTTKPTTAPTTKPTTKPTTAPTTVPPVTDEYTVYFYNYNNWSQPQCYMWNSDSDKNHEWPGVSMTKVEGVDGLWKYTTTKKYANCIFNGNGNKTGDLVADYGNVYHGNTGKWSPYNNGDFTVYFKNTNNWSNVYCYMWNNDGDKNNSWPGVAMTNLGNGVWSYKASKFYGSCIFYNSESNRTGDIVPAKYGQIYNFGTSSWSAYANSDSADSYLSIEPIENDRATVKLSSNIEYYYYGIKEKTPDSSDTYFYDKDIYYVVVELNRSTMKATPYYFKEADKAVNAVKDKNFAKAIKPENVVFNNYHKGSIIIEKKNGMTQPINDGVTFSLYKVDGHGAEINEANVVESNKAITDGKVAFTDLHIYTNNNKGEHFQWYCFIETKAKEGYNISTEKHYFAFPIAEIKNNASAEDVAYTIGENKYVYTKDENGDYVFKATYSPINYPVIVPYTSGGGVNSFVVIGVSIICVAGLLTIAYSVTTHLNRKKRVKRCLAHLKSE